MVLLQPYQKRGDFLDRMLQDFDDFFRWTNRFPTILDNRDWDLEVGTEIPKIDVVEYDDRLEVWTEVPGLTKKDVSIKVENNYLTIEGRHKEEKKNEEEKNIGKYLYKERKAFAFKRSFQLSDILDKNNITAEYENGILKVIIPKVEPKEVKIKNIEIK